MLVADAFGTAGWQVLTGGRGRPRDAADRQIDLADAGSVVGPVGEVDVVVSTVPDARLVAERIVLERGGLMLNLSAEPAIVSEELQRGPAATRATGTVVMNAGVAPGVTNLVAADLLVAHPEADEVELVLTVTTKGSGGSSSGDFAHRGLTGVAHHRTTRVMLPEPYGGRRALGFAEAERGWLGPVAAGLAVNTYVCLAERGVHGLMLGLNHARLISRLPRAALGPGRRTDVAGASREPVAHSVSVLRGGRRIATTLVRGAGDFRMAAASSVVFADALLGRDGGHACGAGVFNPEEALSLRRLATGLDKAGIHTS